LGRYRGHAGHPAGRDYVTRSPCDIDHLSASSLRLYLDCPRRWAAHYLDEIPRSTSSALLKGRAVDIAATENWSQKIETGTDLPIEQAQEIAEDALYVAVEEAGGREAIDWEKGSLGETLDAATRMTRRHMIDHAPRWRPTEVQKRIVKRLPDGRDFLGFIDAVAPEGLIDVKTGARKMSQNDADRDIQASAYAWLADRVGPFYFARVVLTNPKSQTTSEVVITQRTKAGIDGFAELALQVSGLIDDGVYPRIPGWGCAYCPILNTCPVGQPNT